MTPAKIGAAVLVIASLIAPFSAFAGQSPYQKDLKLLREFRAELTKASNQYFADQQKCMQSPKSQIPQFAGDGTCLIPTGGLLAHEMSGVMALQDVVDTLERRTTEGYSECGDLYYEPDSDRALAQCLSSSAKALEYEDDPGVDAYFENAEANGDSEKVLEESNPADSSTGATPGSGSTAAISK